MAKQTFIRTMSRFLGVAAVMGATALILVSCATPLLPSNASDQIANLHQMTANGFDHLEADDRQMKTDLGNISAAVDGNNEKTLSLIDDLAKQLKAMQTDIAEIKARLSATPNAGTTMPPPATQYTTFVQALSAGKTMFDQAQYGPAGEALRAALTLAANDVEKLQALYWLGETAFAQRDYPTAERSYTDAITLNSQSLEAWMGFERLGDIDRFNNNGQGALDKYNAILSQYPKYPGADRIKAKIAEIKSGAPAPAPAAGIGAPGAAASGGGVGNGMGIAPESAPAPLGPGAMAPAPPMGAPPAASPGVPAAGPRL